jgi:signal peptidase I
VNDGNDRRLGGLARAGIVIGGALLLALFLRVAVFRAYRIESSSMENTLLDGDYIMAERVTYGAVIERPFSSRLLCRLPGIREPHRGDIVIFRDSTGTEMIKRCVAVGGDSVTLRDNVLYVNGIRFDSTCVKGTPFKHARHPRSWSYYQRIQNYGPHVVAQDHFFVMGDNRDNSEDSRLFGDVSVDRLRGRALVIYFSHAPLGSREGIRWERIGRFPRQSCQ